SAEREQAVAEARRGDCVDVLVAAADRLADEPDDLLRIGSSVHELRLLVDRLRALVPDLRSNRRRADVEREHAGHAAYPRRVAVLIASNLKKELAGSLLFEGVSFKVERRDRVALSGPNGAGKTTLLRLLTGETELHGGELAFAKGTRVALHDQRPPLQQGLSLREYILSGAAELADTEAELRRLEGLMASGDHGP